MSGKVYLVGAGPGDPGLLTLKGADCLSRADIVLYDSLANEALLAWANPNAACLLVGKRQGLATVSQDEIERLVIEHARAGRVVVRLKGGDPFIFGRGGEEAEACKRAGIEFEIVPGVTSAIAAPAYAGIPLTHRDHASSVTFVAGQPGETRGTITYDWQALARLGGTLVFLMASLRAREIAGSLMAAGLAATTPAAAIRWGTTPRQRSRRGTLADIAATMEADSMRPPVVLVIGSVAGLADDLGWYEALPLFGRRIVVTRARHQASELARRIEALGGEAVEFPTIEIAEPFDGDAIERTLERVSDYDWVVLTSANGAERFLRHVLSGDRDIRRLGNVRFAAIGPATAAVLERHGIRTAARPDEYRAEALVEALGSVAGLRILLARAERAREVLPEELKARGAIVDVLTLYRTVMPAERVPVERLHDVDMLTFTSASTVDQFVTLTGREARPLLERTPMAAIGPVTAAALAKLGVTPDVVANPYTIEALVAAIVAFFANRKAAA